MRPLHTALTEYLDLRRALGFKRPTVGSTLRQCVHFANQEGATRIPTDLALPWATQPQRAQPDHWARRLGMVRCFAQYCHALDARHAIPPQGLLPHRSRRKPPYMYSEQEINRLIEAARRLRSATGLRPGTYAT